MLRLKSQSNASSKKLITISASCEKAVNVVVAAAAAVVVVASVAVVVSV